MAKESTKKRGGAQAFRKSLEASSELVKAMTVTDEASIDETIKLVDDEIGKLTGLRYSLKLMKRAASAYANGRPTKAPRGSKKKAAVNKTQDTPLVQAMMQLLRREGEQSVAGLVTHTRVANRLVVEQLEGRPDLFENTRPGYWKLK